MASHRKNTPASTATGNSASGQGSTQEPKHRKLSRRQRVMAWAASLGGVAVAAFVTAFAGNFGDHAAALVSSAGARPAPGHAPVGEPVTVDYAALEQQPSSAEAVAFPRPVTLTARQLKQLNATPDFAAETAWLTAHGAVNTSLDILVIVQDNRPHTVTITDLEPVVRCTRPLRGALFWAPTAGADPITQLNLNLDTPQAPLSYTEYYQLNGEEMHKTISDYFGHYTIPLKPGEQFTFAVDATTQLRYCQFTLDMTVIDGTRTVTEPVTDHGKPFQVTTIYWARGISPAFSRYSTVYLGGLAAVSSKISGWGWSRVNPATAASSP